MPITIETDDAEVTARAERATRTVLCNLAGDVASDVIDAAFRFAESSKLDHAAIASMLECAADASDPKFHRSDVQIIELMAQRARFMRRVEADGPVGVQGNPIAEVRRA